MKHRKSFRMKLLSLTVSALLLCGFGWDWTVSFAALVLFPIEEAIDTQLVTAFPQLVDPDDLLFYFSDPRWPGRSPRASGQTFPPMCTAGSSCRI